MKRFYWMLRDILITDLVYVLPALARWTYHLKIKKDITSSSIEGKNGDKATLYQHGRLFQKDESSTAILILHGLFSHSFVMLHVAEMAQTLAKPVYSLSLKYNIKNPETHRHLINSAIENIHANLGNNASGIKKIVMVGHSMGGSESAFKAFVDRDPRISAVISIAGRLRVIESPQFNLNKIFEGIQCMPNFPLYQMAGKKDWNAPIEATIVGKDKKFCFVLDNAMHFNILFNKSLGVKLIEFMKQALSHR